MVCILFASVAAFAEQAAREVEAAMSAAAATRERGRCFTV
jgi:hypothetical protein